MVCLMALSVCAVFSCTKNDDEVDNNVVNNNEVNNNEVNNDGDNNNEVDENDSTYTQLLDNNNLRGEVE